MAAHLAAIVAYASEDSINRWRICADEVAVAGLRDVSLNVTSEYRLWADLEETIAVAQGEQLVIGIPINSPFIELVKVRARGLALFV